MPLNKFRSFKTKMEYSDKTNLNNIPTARQFTINQFAVPEVQ